MSMGCHRHIVFWLWVLLLVGLAGGQSLAGGICGQRQAAVVEITREQKAMETFSVALADTPHRRQTGLMHCPGLAPGTGMLFVYPKVGKRVFWMKNTLIELAIIFISADGKVVSIAHGEPGSLARIHSPAKTGHVLEINYAESLHLAVGDRVRWHRLPASDDTPAQ